MKSRLGPLLLSVLATAFFYFKVMSTYYGFNMLPHLIYEYIDSGGPGEEDFIFFFDAAFGVVVFIVSYKLFSYLFNRR